MAAALNFTTLPGRSALTTSSIFQPVGRSDGVHRSVSGGSGDGGDDGGDGDDGDVGDDGDGGSWGGKVTGWRVEGVEGLTSSVEVTTPHSLFLVGHLILTAI